MEEITISPPIETPLAQHHRESGATFGVWFGCNLPSDFGDWNREYGFATETIALLDKNYRAYLDFTGPDRVRYLNAILTNNIKDLALNQGVVSLFLNPQGRIQAEIESYALPESIFCISFAEIRSRLVEGLEKFIIMDDVTLADRASEFSMLALEGPKTAEVVKTLTGYDLQTFDELEFRDAQVNSTPVRLLRRFAKNIPGVEFLVERTNTGSLWNTLQEAARAAGGGPAGYTALNALCLEQNIPWFGYDFGEKQIPHEAGLQDSHISYTKGCYTGQEIVERVRSRGQVNRVRVLLQFSGAEIPAANTELFADGKEIGLVTRAAYSPKFKNVIGMGYLRREKAAPGTQIETASGTATVLQLP